jgi:hypothetical protein
LVRLNHNHNCLLCHPAAARGGADDTVVRVDVPIPSDRQPGSSDGQQSYTSGGYDLSPRTNLIVRLDITYLRQDFSVTQKVPDTERSVWPSMQRFDFLVRTRQLTVVEAEGLRKRLKEAGPSPYKKAASEALRKLTGRDLGTDAAAWRRYLASRKR